MPGVGFQVGQRLQSRDGQVYRVADDGSFRREGHSGGIGPKRVRRRKRERVILQRFARLVAKAQAEGRLGDLEAAAAVS